MKIAAITNGISNNYEEACRIMNETGIRYAEIQNHNGQRIELCPVEEAHRIRDLSARYGIQPVCVTTHAFVGIPVGQIEVDSARYREELALLRHGIELSRIIGADLVRSMCFSKQIVTFGSHGGENWIAGGNRSWGKLLELYRPIAELAQREGVTLVVENGFNGMISSAALFRRFHRELGCERIQFLWDPANALYHGELPTPQVYEGIKDSCAHIHIKDLKVNTVDSSVDVRQIGRGDMAPYLLDMAAALREHGYEGCVSLENIYQPDGGDFVDGYRLDIRELKAIFGD